MVLINNFRVNNSENELINVNLTLILHIQLGSFGLVRLKLSPYYHFHHFIFTALHGMQTQCSDENSVCLSVKCVHCDKT